MDWVTEFLRNIICLKDFIVAGTIVTTVFMNLKQLMKKTIVAKLKTSFTIMFLLFLFTACEKQEDTDVRNDFIGNWLVNENSSLLGQRTYEVSIVKDSINSSQIYIYNFYKIGIKDSVFSIISGLENYSITIPKQTSKNNVAEGSGTLSKNVIVISYYINDGNQIDTVSANYTRDYN